MSLRIGLGACLALVASLSTTTVARGLRADSDAPAHPQLPLHDDTRFGEIGRPGPDPDEGETPSPAAGVAANRVGHVTYAGARVDVPFGRRFSLIPQAALLHVQPYAAGDPHVLVPYVGGGVGFRPAPGWSTELSGLYGPDAHGIESVSAIFGVAKEIGADWANDVPPPLTLEIAASYNHFRWANGNGPAGARITQWFGQVQALFRATRRFHVIPRAMYFLYSDPLTGAVGPRLGSITVLSQVGTYAPRYLLGGRVGYLIGTRVFPFVDAQQIEYAEDIGAGTQVAGGVKVMLGRTSSVMAMGGVLWNRVGGPLVPADYDLSRVPVIGTEVELGF